MGNVQNVHHYANNMKEVVRFEAVTDSIAFIAKNKHWGKVETVL